MASYNPTNLVVPSRIPLATAVAAVGSTLCNLGVHVLAQRTGRMTIGYTETVLASVIGAALGGLVYWLLGRTTTHAVRWFTVLSVLVVAVYGLGPVLAANEPYMEGAELFTTTTVIATELMHIVSAAWILWAMLRLARVAR